MTSTLTVRTTGATVVSLDRRMTDGSGWLRGGVALARCCSSAFPARDAGLGPAS